MLQVFIGQFLGEVHAIGSLKYDTKHALDSTVQGLSFTSGQLFGGRHQRLALSTVKVGVLHITGSCH